MKQLFILLLVLTFASCNLKPRIYNVYNTVCYNTNGKKDTINVISNAIPEIYAGNVWSNGRIYYRDCKGISILFVDTTSIQR